MNTTTTARWWQQTPWRMIQTNLREIDMLDMDAEVYVQQLTQLGATVALLNVGGIIASYPTALPFHHQSDCLRADSLAQVIAACHNAGIRVIARMDFSKIRREVYESHPEWAYRTASGHVVDYNGDVHACLMGGYQQEAALEIVREVLQTLSVDGIFMNMGGFRTSDYSGTYHGICHCDACRRAFDTFCALPLPVREDMNDPAYRKYRAFQRRCTAEYRERIRTLIRTLNPDAALLGEDFFRMESNTEYRRPLPFWQYSASSNTRCVRGMASGRVVSNTTVDFVGFRYRHVAVSPQQQKLRLWQDLANLGGLDYYIIGRLDNHADRSGYEPVQEVFKFHRMHERSFMGLTSRAQALVVRNHAWSDGAEERGWIRALTENHILFDEVVWDVMEPEKLSRYQAVILPGTEALREADAAALDAYAQAGGCVISSGGLTVYNERYETTGQSLLRCLGIANLRAVRTDMLSAMLEMGAQEHALLPSLAATDVVMMGETLEYAAYEPDTTQLLRLIPPQRFGPPERCYGMGAVDATGLALHTHGKGLGVHVAFRLGELYYREGYDNSFALLTDLLTQIAGLTNTAPEVSPMVEVTVADRPNDEGMLVQLVNNSGHFGVSYFAPIPVEGVWLTLDCPRRPQTCVSLSDGRTVPFQWAEGKVMLEAGRLGEYDALELEYE